MLPGYSDNDYVVVSSLPYFFVNPKIGDVVVFEQNNKFLIKRVSKRVDNKYFLSGDNSKDSLDSRKFGMIERQRIKGKVIIKL